MSGLSLKVLAVCREHWSPRPRRCEKCPILSTCTSPVGGGQAELDAYRERMNKAAESAR